MQLDNGARLVVFLTLGVSAGCGDGSSSGALDCAWLRSDSCWSRMVEEIRQCAAAETTQGTFNSDGTVCTYEDGLEVRFDSSRSEDHFALFREGSACLRYDDNGDDGVAALTLTAASGTLSTSGTPSGFTVTCPDGSSYFTDSPMSLYNGCGEDALNPPGVTTVSARSLNLGLRIRADEKISLFDCI